MQAQPLPKRLFTVAEWEKLPDQPRYELFDGDIVMQARPSAIHQETNVELTTQLRTYLRGKKYHIFSELAVRFEYNDTVLVPDIIVVCDPSKIHKNYCVGAPDLIIEILSPSTGGIDKVLKLDRYQSEGVREYWIVDSTHRVVDVYQWDNGLCPPHPYTAADKIKVGVLEDCEIDLSLVFPAIEEDETPDGYLSDDEV